MQSYLPFCAFVKDWIYTSQRFLPFTMEFLELVLKVIVYIFLLKSSVKTCDLKGLSPLRPVALQQYYAIKSPIHKSCYIHLLYTHTNKFRSYWGMSVVICLQWFPCNNSSSSYIMTRTSCIRWEDYVHSIRPTHFFSAFLVFETLCRLTCSTLLFWSEPTSPCSFSFMLHV